MTVGGWIREYGVDLETIDVRRFISFGVIKGFLRRVHRWPVLLKDDKLPLPPSLSKRRHKSVHLPAAAPPSQRTQQNMEKEVADLQMGNPVVPSDFPPGLGSAGAVPGSGAQEPAEKVLVTRPIQVSSAAHNDTVRPTAGIGSYFGPPALREPPGTDSKAAKQAATSVPVVTSSSYVPPSVLKSRLKTGVMSYDSTANEEEDPHAVSLPIAQELAGQALAQGQVVARLKGATGGGGMGVEVPPELSDLLDGTHHSDELCVRFGQSWNVLKATLGVIGGGTGDDGDLGRVVILYR